MPYRRLVLDWGSQSMSSKHLIPCNVQLHQKLHLQPGIFRSQRHIVQPVSSGDIYLCSRQHRLLDMYTRLLLPFRRDCYSHSVCVWCILSFWFCSAECVSSWDIQCWSCQCLHSVCWESKQSSGVWVLQYVVSCVCLGC